MIDEFPLISRTLSNVLNSHAEHYICAPLRPTLYGYKLVVTSAS